MSMVALVTSYVSRNPLSSSPSKAASSMTSVSKVLASQSSVSFVYPDFVIRSPFMC